MNEIKDPMYRFTDEKYDGSINKWELIGRRMVVNVKKWGSINLPHVISRCLWCQEADWLISTSGHQSNYTVRTTAFDKPTNFRSLHK